MYQQLEQLEQHCYHCLSNQLKPWQLKNKEQEFFS
jgi:hypothetical protein